MAEVLYAILPVFVIIALGMAVTRGEWLPASTSQALNIYVLHLSLPVLLLNIIAQAKPEELFQARIWLSLLGAQLLVYLLGYLGDCFTLRRGAAGAAVTATSCSSSLTVFVGLPIVMNLLPNNHEEVLLMGGILAIMPILTILMGQLHLEILRQRGSGGALGILRVVLVRAVIKNPLMIGMLLGTGLCLSGSGLWTPLARAADLVGSTAAPCSLLAIGLDLQKRWQVGMRGFNRSKAFHQTGIALSKLIIHPLLTWAALALCGVDGVWLAACVIMCGTATAIGGYVVAEIYHAVPEESALSIVLTSGLSLLTLSLLAYAFKLLGII